jgi:hypothetical protein
MVFISMPCKDLGWALLDWGLHLTSPGEVFIPIKPTPLKLYPTQTLYSNKAHLLKLYPTQTLYVCLKLGTMKGRIFDALIPTITIEGVKA